MKQRLTMFVKKHEVYIILLLYDTIYEILFEQSSKKQPARTYIKRYAYSCHTVANTFHSNNETIKPQGHHRLKIFLPVRNNNNSTITAKSHLSPLQKKTHTHTHALSSTLARDSPRILAKKPPRCCFSIRHKTAQLCQTKNATSYPFAKKNPSQRAANYVKLPPHADFPNSLAPIKRLALARDYPIIEASSSSLATRALVYTSLIERSLT